MLLCMCRLFHVQILNKDFWGCIINTTRHSAPVHQLLLFLCRNCTSRTKPPGGCSGPHSLRAVSAAHAYGKLMQERSLSDFKTSQLLFINQLQENLVKDPEQLRMQVGFCGHVDYTVLSDSTSTARPMLLFLLYTKVIWV